MPKLAPTPTELLQTLSANLKVLRERGNWSTRALAEQAKLGRRTVQRIEQGEFKTVTLDTVDRLARALGVKTASLLSARPLSHKVGDRLVQDVMVENLVAARTSREWSQETLSQCSGVSRYVIARIETQAVSPDLSTLERLAEAMRVSTRWLLTERRSARTARE